jgi:hypothetical protein
VLATSLAYGANMATSSNPTPPHPTPPHPPPNPQNVLATSLAYGAYMATSSNLRYQLVAGVIEERGIETAFAGNYRLCGALSLLVRTGNTFIGSLWWVDWIHWLGMQSSGH